jgi:CelD/BcsL family acetyltransferase involved in cellulose biosynthesis
MTGFDNATAAIATVRRASAADRHSAMSFDIERRPLAEIASIAEEWRTLAARAVEANVFYEPSFALAAASLLGADVHCGLIWSQTPRRLVGFFPYRIDRRRYGVPFPVMVAWTHPYAPLSAPLIDRDMAGPVIAAWLDHIAENAALPDLILMPLISQKGPFAVTLADLLARRGCEAKSFDPHQRALLLPGESRSDYFKRTMSSKRLRNIRRRERRIEELGAVTVEEAKGIEAIALGLDDFFRLEATGWKGRAGTAATQNEEVRRFFQGAIAGLASEDKVLIHRLLANGKAIGATIALKSSDACWGWKVAYDEFYADYSPGILSVLGLTKTVLADPSITQADSCAAAGDTMASQLWHDHLTMVDWLFTATPGAEFSFGLAWRLEALRRTTIAAAKSARAHLRRR